MNHYEPFFTARYSPCYPHKPRSSEAAPKKASQDGTAGHTWNVVNTVGFCHENMGCNRVKPNKRVMNWTAVLDQHWLKQIFQSKIQYSVIQHVGHLPSKIWCDFTIRTRHLPRGKSSVTAGSRVEASSYHQADHPDFATSAKTSSEATHSNCQNIFRNTMKHI